MPRKIADTKKMTHDQWVQLRKSSIGGSDSAICVNMNPYSGSLSLYADKMGLSKEKDTSEAMRLGTDLEQYVAERFMEKTGKKVRNDFAMYADDDYDFITANIDRKVVGENAGLECKVMGSFHGYNFENGDVPSHYYCQCQHYMMVMGFDMVYLAILVLQRGLYVIEIKRDDDFIKSLREAETAFWTQYIQQGIMPAPDSSTDLEVLKELYPNPVKGSKITIEGLDRMIKEYRVIKELADDYTKRADTYKGTICKLLGSNEAAVGQDYGCTYKQQSRLSGYDMARLQADYPNIDINKYKKITKYRVFRTQDLTKKKKGKGA